MLAFIAQTCSEWSREDRETEMDLLGQMLSHIEPGPLQREQVGHPLHFIQHHQPGQSFQRRLRFSQPRLRI